MTISYLKRESTLLVPQKKKIMEQAVKSHNKIKRSLVWKVNKLPKSSMAIVYL